LQRGFTSFSTEVTNITTKLDEVLTRFRDDPRVRRRSGHEPLRDELIPAHSSSSQDEHSPRRRRRPTGEDDLRDMRIDPLNLREP